jgi:hypothetical protein
MLMIVPRKSNFPHQLDAARAAIAAQSSRAHIRSRARASASASIENIAPHNARIVCKSTLEHGITPIMAPAHRGKFIAYYRVSTQRQGRSGFGLDAQRKDVADYLNGGSWQLVGEFTEVESGMRIGRNSPRLSLLVVSSRPS